MSLWKYIISTPKQAIYADYKKYKDLCNDINNAKINCLNLKISLVIDLAYETDKDLLKKQNGCIIIKSFEKPDAVQKLPGIISVFSNNCEFFNETRCCDKETCSFYNKNAEYFKAKRACRALEKQKRIYWKQKFTNAR